NALPSARHFLPAQEQAVPIRRWRRFVKLQEIRAFLPRPRWPAACNAPAESWHLETSVTSVASHPISSVRPEIAEHKSHKEQPTDGSFGAMLDSALPDAGNERLGDDGARKSPPNASAPNASAPSVSAPSDAPASGPGDSPSAKSGKTSDSPARPASTKAADGKPAGTKPAKAHPHHGAGTCE